MGNLNLFIYLLRIFAKFRKLSISFIIMSVPPNGTTKLKKNRILMIFFIRVLFETVVKFKFH
jgi:hypothetical protein